MGLINGSLQIGRSAVLAHQSAMQVIGNNIANAGNSDYTRQTAKLTSLSGARLPEGFDSGAGVQLSNVVRNIDEALEQRLREALSNQSHDDLISQTLGRLETLYNEMTENDLSTGLSEFFNAFSKLQSTPQDVSSRTVVVQQGQALVSQIRNIRQDIVDVYNETADKIGDSVDQINRITKQIADLNVRIANAQSGGETAGALADKRDALLKELSSQVDIEVVQQTNGSMTVYVNSEPLVQDNIARQLKVQESPNGDLVMPEIVFVDNNRKLTIHGGQAGAIDELITTLINTNLNDLDKLAQGLIFEVNKVHASGQGLHGYSSVTSSNTITDPDAVLNQAGLTFAPKNGTFLITMKDKNTNQETVHQINVNLSGLGQQVTLNDIIGQINAIPNLSATLQPDGSLNIAATDDAHTFTFKDDSSYFLAAMGINGYFTGTDASTIAINPDIVEDPQLTACSKNNLPGDGTNAAAISLLRTAPAESFNGLSIMDYYRALVGNVGTQTSSAKNQLETHAAITETLQAQRESVSGVSLDEETINLMASQRAFQGAARFINVVNELMQEVLQLI